MKICLVSAELAPLIPGGAGTYAFELAQALRNAGASVHVLTHPRPGIETLGDRGLRGVAIHVVRPREGAAAVPAFNCRALRHSMAVYEALLPLHERERFDVIEFPDFGGEAYFSLRARRTLGRFEDTTIAIRCHTPIAVCKRYQGDASLNRSDVIVEHMERFCLEEADVVTAPSRAVVDEVTRTWSGVFAESPAVFANPMGRREEGLQHQGGAVEVLFTGRLEWLKGPDLLLHAARELLAEGLDFRLRLIGRDTRNSPAGRSVRRMLRESIEGSWRDRIRFDRPMGRDELMEVVSRASVVVVPSRYENQSYAIAEAMALGRCIVASDAGGTPEMIEDGTSGLLFSADDAGALREALRTAVNDAALRERLGRAASERVRAVLEPATAARRWLDACGLGPRPTPAPPQERDALVSILIPHFNAGPFIDETIASARAQTHTPTEIVLVDDGSDDSESLWALERIEREGHVRVIRADHAGVSATRNRAIAEARGEFVLMLDADDIADPTLVAKGVQAMRRNPDASYCSPLIADFENDPGEPTGGWIPLGLDPDILAIMNVASAGTGAFFRRSVFDGVAYDESLPAYEDWDLFCTLCERRHAGEIIPEFLIRYRQSPGSLMRSKGRPNHGALHAYLLAKHPELARRPSVSLRLLLSQAERARGALPDQP